MRAIYKLDNKTNIDYICLRHNILKFKDIINIYIYKYMFRIYTLRKIIGSMDPYYIKMWVNEVLSSIICIVQFVSYLPIIDLYILFG